MIKWLVVALALVAGFAYAGQGMGPGPGIYRVSLAAPDAPVVSSVSNDPPPLTATWGAVGGATSYNLYYRAGSAPTTSTYDGLVTGVTSPYTVSSGLSGGTTYHVGVTAVNGAGASALSNTMSAVAATPSYAYGFEDELTTGLVAGGGSVNTTILAHTGSYAGFSTEPAEVGTYYTRYSKAVSPNQASGHVIWLKAPESVFDYTESSDYRIKKGSATVASGTLALDSGWNEVVFDFSNTTSETLTIEIKATQYTVWDEGTEDYIYEYDSSLVIDDIAIY